jgi:quinol-cytochrome oxidoreductase complex cytochrome b subunit
VTTLKQTGILRALRGVLRSPVPPEHRLDLAFGWLVAVLFGVQVVTGVLLSLHYQPSSVLVAESLEFIMRDVHWGWLIRGVHHWASNVLLVVILIQLVKLFVLGAYRGARATGWTLALLMLLLFVLATFSGQILRWDDPSWRLAVASLKQVESIPLIGPWLAGVLRGEEEVTATTLGRTFTAHALVLPWVAGLLVLLNQWILARRVRREGGARR